ncbi:MAG: NADH-quinone oxidoreductase subunit 2 [bacterium ADurb.Bin431]|nr:MAG: NADH-quinone oxidoreductase subunit 2 [bacterium ADurb.Bin431]HNY91106.1 NAD(P)H-dependent oxidoreductase subunit E [bacterium]HOH06308.1 NAD(P)H-dependent oxidoreductase subunit E [bacterium]
MSIAFSATAQKRVEKLLGHYPDKEAALLQVLHIARAEFKTITPEVMEYIAGLLGLSPLQVMDVVSFYTLYPRQEEGRYVIQVCATLSCALLGAESLVDHLEEKLGIKVGGTTPDKKFTLKKVECLGSCGTAPVMQINDDYYENLTVEKIDDILAKLP